MTDTKAAVFDIPGQPQEYMSGGKFRATIRRWEEITGYKILDPDGFDRKDQRLYDRLFTYNEWSQGMMLSTTQHSRNVTVAPHPHCDKPKGLLPEEL